ncbi:MAG: caspase family protein, partial [Rivularia sp. (in: cyanobacteria)]
MGQNWAIAIGINNYDNLSPLKYARRDAEVMKHWFEQEAGFDEVFLFTENSPKIPANPPIATQPTHARFLRFLNVQFEDTLLQPEDNLWFFFAGHGTRFKDQDYLMFLDSDPQAVDRTAISVDYVVQRLRRCGADNVVLLIDACRDEGSRSGLGIGEKHKGVITFYSCAANQKSWEIDELQHGTFTHTLLEGLRLQGEFNCATVERLDQYLRYNVPKINSNYQKPVQNPYLKAEPPYKMYFILLKQAARLQDVVLLKNQAYQAENRDLSLAKQLWKRVVAAVGYDSEAFEAIERIAVRQAQFPIYPSSQPDIAITQPVT